MKTTKQMHFLLVLYRNFIYLQPILLIINMLKSKNEDNKNIFQMAEKCTENVIFR